MLVVGHVGAGVGVLGEGGVGRETLLPFGLEVDAPRLAAGWWRRGHTGRQRGVAGDGRLGRVWCSSWSWWHGVALDSGQGVGRAQHGTEVKLCRVADVGQDRGGVLHPRDRHGDLVVARRAHLRPRDPEAVDPAVQDVHRLLQLGLGHLVLRLVDDGQSPGQVQPQLGRPFGTEHCRKRAEGDGDDSQDADEEIPPLPLLGSRRRRAHASSASSSP